MSETPAPAEEEKQEQPAEQSEEPKEQEEEPKDDVSYDGTN